MTRTLLSPLLTVAAIMLASPGVLPAAEQKAVVDKPNIIFILADDLCLDGVGCYGSDTYKKQTPHIDALAHSLRLEMVFRRPKRPTERNSWNKAAEFDNPFAKSR